MYTIRIEFGVSNKNADAAKKTLKVWGEWIFKENNVLGYNLVNELMAMFADITLHHPTLEMRFMGNREGCSAGKEER